MDLWRAATATQRLERDRLATNAADREATEPLRAVEVAKAADETAVPEEDVEEIEDPMDAVKVNGKIRFVGTPVYGMVEIEKNQALADAMADHARRCTAGTVLITYITAQIDAIFPQSRTEVAPRNEWHGIAEYCGTRGGLVKELHVRMTTVCLCNPGTETTAISCLLAGQAVAKWHLSLQETKLSKG